MLSGGGNPALSERSLKHFQDMAVDQTEVMTVNGTINRTLICLMLVVAGAILTWNMVLEAVEAKGFAGIMPWVLGGAIGGLVCSLIIWFKPVWAPWAAPLYGFCEGLFLGAISAFFELAMPGIVMNAACLTFGTLFVMLLAYRSGLIKVTEKFRSIMYIAIGSIALVYLVNMVMYLFGSGIPFIHSSGPVGIGFSIVVLVVAALTLLLDFDFIENGARARAPKFMEWVGAWGLVVTLVWLYIEFLRLLAKLRSD